MQRRTYAVFFTLLLSASLATAQTKIKPGFNLFSPDQDVQVGQQSAAQAMQQMPILNDRTVTDYVNRIALGWKKSNYDVKTLLRDVFTSPEFLQTAAYRSLVKTQTELMVHVARALEAPQRFDRRKR